MGCEKTLSNWGLAWSACFLQLFGQSNKIGGKMLQILWILWNGDNFPSNSFPLYCALARAKIQVHWVNGTLRNCGRTGLALSTPALSAFQLFLWIFSTPGLPFTTASLVIYGNPCGMQDGYSIFIENYQSEDLGSIHRQSKPSLHLPDSFRLKISENLWKSRHKNLPEIPRNCFFVHKGSYWSRYLCTPGWHSQLDIRRITMSLSWLRRLFSIHGHVSIQHMLGLSWSIL